MFFCNAMYATHQTVRRRTRSRICAKEVSACAAEENDPSWPRRPGHRLAFVQRAAQHGTRARRSPGLLALPNHIHLAQGTRRKAGPGATGWKSSHDRYRTSPLPLAAQSTGAESSGSIIPNVLIHLSLYSAGVPAPQIWVVVPQVGQSADVACRAWLSLMHVISLELGSACACQTRVAGTKTRRARPGEAEAKALRRHHPDPNPRT